MTTKYIVIKAQTECGSIETIVIFPGFIQHADMVRRIAKDNEEVMSAGFVSFATSSCFGKSISLNLESREVDTILLKLLTEGG